MKLLSFPSPLGILCAVEENEMLVALLFGGEGTEETPLLQETRRQLDAYFRGHLQQFDLPLNARGSDFRRRVWQRMAAIPYGQVLSYGALAAELGSPGAARAVGTACHHNPLPIVLPCHRVVGSKGALVGYAGGVDKKSFLLRLEQGAR